MMMVVDSAGMVHGPVTDTLMVSHAPPRSDRGLFYADMMTPNTEFETR